MIDRSIVVHNELPLREKKESKPRGQGIFSLKVLSQYTQIELMVWEILWY